MAAARRALAVGLALALAGCQTARAPRPLPATHTLFPGTRVALVLPEGFRHEPRLGAFESADGRSAIFASELPGSVYATLRSFSAEAFQRSGMRLLGHERVRVDGWPARLYRASQPARDAELARWVLVFGDSSTSVVLTAVTPEETRPALEAPLLATLRSAQWHRQDPPAATP
jgi:hypothetical protein